MDSKRKNKIKNEPTKRKAVVCLEPEATSHYGIIKKIKTLNEQGYGLLPQEQVKFSSNSKFIPETEFPTHWNGTQFRDYIREQFPNIEDFDFFRGEGNKSVLVKIEETVCPKTFGLHFKRSKIYIIPKVSIEENNQEVSTHKAQDDEQQQESNQQLEEPSLLQPNKPDSDHPTIISETRHDKMSYNPVDQFWQTERAKSLNLNIVSSTICQPSEILPTNCDDCKTIPIKGDGNCLFRSLSVVLTGSQDAHVKLRQLLCDYMLQHQQQINKFSPSSDYVNTGKMQTLGKWGTELELTAFASMIDTDIVVLGPYNDVDHRWLTYQPDKNLPSKAPFTKTNQKIYLTNIRSHFEPVQNISINPNHGIEITPQSAQSNSIRDDVLRLNSDDIQLAKTTEAVPILTSGDIVPQAISSTYFMDMLNKPHTGHSKNDVFLSGPHALVLSSAGQVTMQHSSDVAIATQSAVQSSAISLKNHATSPQMYPKGKQQDFVNHPGPDNCMNAIYYNQQTTRDLTSNLQHHSEKNDLRRDEIYHPDLLTALVPSKLSESEIQILVINLCEALKKNDHTNIHSYLHHPDIGSWINKPIDSVNMPINYIRTYIRPYNIEMSTILHCAAYYSSLSTFELLVKSGADYMEVNRYNQTPLHLAVVSKNEPLEKMRYLLTLDINVMNAVDIHMRTCAHYAASVAEFDCIREFMSHGGNFDIQDSERSTILHTLLYGNSFEDCNNDHIHQLTILLILVKDINTTNRDGKTLLHAAACQKHYNAIKALVEHGCNVNIRDKQGNTVIHVIYYWGKSKEDISTCLKYILPNMTEIDMINDDGESPLHRPATSGCIAAITVLMEHGSNVNIQDKFGNTPCHNYLESNFLTSYDEDIQCLKRLVTDMIDINMKNNNGLTPLHIAANRFNTKAISLLVDHGGKVNIQDQRGNTPLHILLDRFDSDAYDEEAHRALINAIEKYDDINMVNDEGRSLLHIAVSVGNVDIIEAIIKRDAIVNLKDNCGKTPLHQIVVSAMANRHYSTTECFTSNLLSIGDYLNSAVALLECSATLNSEDESVISILAFSFSTKEYGVGYCMCPTCRSDHIESVQCILKHTIKAGVNFQKIRLKGWSPLVMCVDVLTKLADHGEFINMKDEMGNTLLHTVCEMGNFTVASLLAMSYNIDAAANTQNDKLQTPLHLAAIKGYINIVRMLVSNKACDQTIVDTNGNTALAIAQQHLTKCKDITDAHKHDEYNQYIKEKDCDTSSTYSGSDDLDSETESENNSKYDEIKRIETKYNDVIDQEGVLQLLEKSSQTCNGEDMRKKIRQNFTWLAEIKPLKHLDYFLQKDVITIKEYTQFLDMSMRRGDSLLMRSLLSSLLERPTSEWTSVFVKSLDHFDKEAAGKLRMHPLYALD